MILTIMVVLTMGCQSTNETSVNLSTEGPTSTEEIPTYDMPYNLAFDFNPNLSMGQADLSQMIEKIHELIQVHDPNQHNDYINHFTDTYLDPNDSETLMPDDIEDVEVLGALLAQESLFYREMIYLLTIIDEDNLNIGQINTYEADYNNHADFNSIYGPEPDTEVGDVEVFLMMAENELYADIWRFSDSEELANRSIFKIHYDDDGLIAFKMIEFDAMLGNLLLKNKFSYIDYARDETGLMIHVTDSIFGVRDLTLGILDQQGGYEVCTYSSPLSLLSIAKISLEDQYYFWSSYDEDEDFRNIHLYEDNVYQLGYRLSYNYEYESYLSHNNFIEYNLKYIDGWVYLQDREIFYYEGDVLESTVYDFTPSLHPFSPELAPRIQYDIDTQINQTLFEKPLGIFEYNHISYEHFIQIWDSLENVWETTYLLDHQLYFHEITIDMNKQAIDVIYDYTGDYTSIFTNEIRDAYPDAIYDCNTCGEG